MSVQGELENFINNLSEDEAKEILTDFVLPLSNLERTGSESYEFITEIYDRHFSELKK